MIGFAAINNIEMIIDRLRTKCDIYDSKGRRGGEGGNSNSSLLFNLAKYALLSLLNIYIYIHEKQRCEMLGLELMEMYFAPL